MHIKLYKAFKNGIQEDQMYFFERQACDTTIATQDCKTDLFPTQASQSDSLGKYVIVLTQSSYGPHDGSLLYRRNERDLRKGHLSTGTNAPHVYGRSGTHLKD